MDLPQWWRRSHKASRHIQSRLERHRNRPEPRVRADSCRLLLRRSPVIGPIAVTSDLAISSESTPRITNRRLSRTELLFYVKNDTTHRLSSLSRRGASAIERQKRTFVIKFGTRRARPSRELR
ncbi:hypothetical protein EVAR_65840_1 [Eumeta japonica]|uniref:Uncharacterized protein n=1 Tax=Eumeta variegata TaxID=151549 RepID=A0A4C1ZQD4_EUMVA|nr:hypothetical protein EVAR_65840_1 [Eumeta japonica]